MKKFCNIPNCWEKIDIPARYCEAHTLKKHQDYNVTRSKEEKQWYGRKWQKIRLLKLKQCPLCEKCNAPAEHVHHIQALKKGGTHHMSNLMSLCHSCHSKLHAEER